MMRTCIQIRTKNRVKKFLMNIWMRVNAVIIIMYFLILKKMCVRKQKI